jgi:hypothetical protein
LSCGPFPSLIAAPHLPSVVVHRAGRSWGNVVSGAAVGIPPNVLDVEPPVALAPKICTMRALTIRPPAYIHPLLLAVCHAV